MQDTAVMYPAGDIELAATLSRPRGPAPYPTALLISGSGPIDRDSNHKRMPLNLGRDLAAALADVGWASLRYDKRGVGGSSGDYWSTGFFDNVTDAASGVAYSRSRHDVGAVVAIGHSEGALIASLLATNTDIDGAVLLATTAQTGEATLRWQAQKMGADLPPWVGSLLRLFHTSIPKQQDKRLTQIKKSTKDRMRVQLIAKLNAKWFREFLAYDPVSALQKSKVPVLAITGSKDVQVDPADLDVVATVSPPPITTEVIPDVDHLLRHEPAPRSSPRRYRGQLRKPIDERLLEALSDWLPGIAVGTIPGEPAPDE
jgi:hypothetical protein